MSNDLRLRELRSQVLNPTQRLLETLRETNNPILSEFPEIMQSHAPNKRVLVQQLTKLLERTDEMIKALEDRAGSHARKELQHELTNALADVFERHFPEIPARRHHEERWPLRYQATDETRDERDNEFASFIRSCTLEIFPNDKLFVREILDDIARSRHGKAAQ